MPQVYKCKNCQGEFENTSKILANVSCPHCGSEGSADYIKERELLPKGARVGTLAKTGEIQKAITSSPFDSTEEDKNVVSILDPKRRKVTSSKGFKKRVTVMKKYGY